MHVPLPRGEFASYCKRFATDHARMDVRRIFSAFGPEHVDDDLRFHVMHDNFKFQALRRHPLSAFQSLHGEPTSTFVGQPCYTIQIWQKKVGVPNQMNRIHPAAPLWWQNPHQPHSHRMTSRFGPTLVFSASLSHLAVQAHDLAFSPLPTPAKQNGPSEHVEADKCTEIAAKSNAVAPASRDSRNCTPDIALLAMCLYRAVSEMIWELSRCRDRSRTFQD